MFYCMVVGSRDFNDYKLLEKVMDGLLKNFREITIVSGGAKGADKLAETYAAAMGYECIIFNADWSKYGKSAGVIRNEQMHKFIAQYEKRGCVAFWDGQSKGIYSNFELARKYNNALRIIKVNEKNVDLGMDR